MRFQILTMWSIYGIIHKIDYLVNFDRGDRMKREEKNQQTRRRIMDSALAEFSRQGYGASSVNTICSAQNLSKGIIYHYFKTKDDLYLACVEECFQLLTQYLKNGLSVGKSAQEQLEAYFAVRMSFFREYPVYQPIFCGAVISPPAHLAADIQARKQPFDTLNAEILESLLDPLPLCPHVTKEEIVETFRQFQDFINAKYQTANMGVREFEMRDESCRKALNILLYGVIERKEDQYV